MKEIYENNPGANIKDEVNGKMSNEKENYATIYLVRHGQTEWNLRDILQGQLDSPLTEKGLQQARELIGRFKDVEFAAIFSSDLARAKRTAETVSVERNLEINTSELLRERNWGRFDGKPAQLFREECRELIKSFQNISPEEQWKFKYAANIESFAEINARFLEFLRGTAADYRGKNILIVSHQDILKSLLMRLGKTPRRVGNMAMIKISSDGVNIVLNDTDGVEF